MSSDGTTGFWLRLLRFLLPNRALPFTYLELKQEYIKEKALRIPPRNWKVRGKMLKRLQANPQYVRQKLQERKDFEMRLRLSRRAQFPLIDELAAVGLRVRDVWDLVDRKRKHDQAIPVLLDHLRKPYAEEIREGIALALALRTTQKPGWRILVEEYRRPGTGTPVKDALAMALAAASGPAVLSELIALARDPSHGNSRVLLLPGIRRSRRPEAARALRELAADPQLAPQIHRWRIRDKG